ncbi:2,3-diketo-5-methylthiopentyl-1-phosphate enolase [bacterium]|nr:2,3-diketo-5-methylthiopentyl-1-phosphate enolase [bacterium]
MPDERKPAKPRHEPAATGPSEAGLDDAFVARYLVTGVAGDLAKKAEQIAIGQTAGAFSDLPARHKAAVAPHLGRVLSVQEAPTGEQALDEASGKLERQALIEIAFPAANVGHDLGALLVACFGKVSMDGAIRWLDVSVPPRWAARAGGPGVGIDGLRSRWGIPEGRPPLMAILKPCLGLSADEIAELFLAAARGGVDIVKDDEVLAGAAQEGDGPSRRVAACRAAAETARVETGKLCRYAVHLPGPVDEIFAKAERLAAEGADCFLVNAFVLGLPLLQALRKMLDGRVALMAHPAFSGAITGSETHGVASPLLLGKLTRIAGADLVLFPSPYGTVSLRKDVALAVARAASGPIPGVARAFPVPSAGIQVANVSEIVSDFGTDAVVNAGTGIFGFPGGATAGALAFSRAIDAATAGARATAGERGRA